MNKEINNIVVIDRLDYDELVKKANVNDTEIAKQANSLFIKNNLIPVEIKFSEYRNSKNFRVPVSFMRGISTDEVHDALNRIEPLIKEWMDENLSMYDKNLQDRYITEKNCIGLSKRVTNLEEKLKRQRIKYTFLFSYAVVISVMASFLLFYLK